MPVYLLAFVFGEFGFMETITSRGTVVRPRPAESTESITSQGTVVRSKPRIQWKLSQAGEQW